MNCTPSSLAKRCTVRKVDRRRTPGQRAGLTRERVLAAARDLLAERGLEGLTMRALAERLDVAPNALYSHVDGKTALIDAVLDDVLAEVDAPSADTEDPAAGLHALMASTYDVLLAHADLVPLYLARQGARGPNAIRLGDVMLALLARAGVSGPRAREALRVLIVYTIGFAAFTTRAPLGPEPRADELHGNFDSGLRWLLAGVVQTAPGPRSGGRE
jgi:AcrR family transcriptional regulator